MAATPSAPRDEVRDAKSVRTRKRLLDSTAYVLSRKESQRLV